MACYKRIFVIFILSFVVCKFSFCVQPDIPPLSNDYYNNVVTQYESVVSTWLFLFDQLDHNSQFYKDVMYMFDNYANVGYYVYCWDSKPDGSQISSHTNSFYIGSNIHNYSIVFYPEMKAETIVADTATYFQIPCNALIHYTYSSSPNPRAVMYNIYYKSSKLTTSTYKPQTTQNYTGFYMPFSLVGYKSSAINDYVSAFHNGNTTDVITALNNVNESVKQGSQDVSDSINQSTDRILSDDVDESDVNIDSSSVDSVDSSNVTNFLSSIVNTFTDFVTSYDDSANYDISIPFGFVDDNLELTSEQINDFYHQHSALSVIITGFWTFLFGKYVWSYSYKFIMYLKNGDFLNGKDMKGEAITSELL